MLNNPIAQFVAQIQRSQNPLGFIAQKMNTNPQFRHVMSIVQAKSPQELEQYVRNRAKTTNFDLQGFFQQAGLNIK